LIFSKIYIIAVVRIELPAILRKRLDRLDVDNDSVVNKTI
jgi:hypothetical protein